MSEEMAEAIARLEKMQADAADLARERRLSVRLFDECGECLGTGVEDDGNPWEIEGLPPPACPSCEGTGRVLRDGATGGWVQNGMQPCVYPTDDPSEIEVYVIPASWMEAE